MNSINLTGNICNDLELKQTNNGKSVMSFNLAVKRPFSKDTTDFIPVVVYEQPAEYLNKYAHKGTKVAVSGKLTTRKWEDKEGNKRTAFEVVADNVEICESSEAKQGGYTPSAYGGTNTPQFEAFPPNAGEDGLPF